MHFKWDETQITDADFFHALNADIKSCGSAAETFNRGDVEEAKKKILVHFRTRSTPRWYYDLRSADSGEYIKTKFPQGVSSSLKDEADDLLENRFLLADSLADFGPDLDWNIPDIYQHNSVSLNFKRMHYLLILADAYMVYSNADYLEKYKEVLSKYLNDFPLRWENREPDAFRVQNEPVQEAMSTSFRARVWLELLYTPVPYLSSVSLDLTFKMIRSIWFTAWQYRRFDTDKFTEANHHLLERSVAPFIFAVMLPEFPEIACMRNRAREVARDHIMYDFTESGAYLEHTIPYTMRATIEKFYAKPMVLAQLNGTRFLDDECKDRFQTAMDTMFRLIEPNGDFPCIGDGVKGGSVFVKDWIPKGFFNGTAAAAIAEALGIVTGKDWDSGKLPETFCCADDAGYVSDRESWDPESDYWIMSVNTRGWHRHAHLDMLTLHVSVSGTSIINDPAGNLYKLSHGPGTEALPARGFVVNLGSHNTILPCGRPIEDDVFYSTGWNAFIPAVTLEQFDSGKDFSYVRASHRGYPSVECGRELLYIKGAGLLIRDRVFKRSPPPPYNHLQRWNFAPGTELSMPKANLLRASRNGRTLLMIWPDAPGVGVSVEEVEDVKPLTEKVFRRADASFTTDESIEDRERTLPLFILPLRNNDKEPAAGAEIINLLGELIHRPIDISGDARKLRRLHE